MNKKVLVLPLAGLLGVVASHFAVGSESAESFKKAYVRPTEVPYPAENPFTKEKAELGRNLFFDPRVSGSQMISCASCHNPSFSWGDSLPKAVGHGHKTLGRRTPTILNLAWGGRMFWDGRAANLEEQALGPIESEGEMNMKIEGQAGLLDRLKAIPGYAPLFAAAFPGEEDPITKPNIGKAIATFERGVVSAKAPFDKWVAGEKGAISESAQRGFVIFNTKAKCVGCHSTWNFTDNSFQDIGIPGDDIGRGKILKLASMQFAFKTPTLRNVDKRGPYMHDGSEATLEDVVKFYNQGGKAKRADQSPLLPKEGLGLNETEIEDLVAFMKTLTSQDKPQPLPILPR